MEDVRGESAMPKSIEEAGDADNHHSLPHLDRPHLDNPSSMTDEKEKAQQKKWVQTFAGVIGNVLEWYDFAVFGYFSDVIGDVFFPPQDGHAAMIESFTIFGLAFFMRPLGGILLGYVGDKYGRKKALEISIFLMAFPTFAMGCLPGYKQVGILAVVLLTIVRLLQGLSVGGQLVSSLVYTVENNPKEKWGLYGSFVLAASNFGTLLGGVVAAFMRSVLTAEELESWGWRLPFLSGILVSMVGFYLRSQDDDVIQHGGDTSTGNPIKEAFRKENLRSLLSATLVPMLWAGGVYLSFVWMATFMDVFIEMDNAFVINSLALLISICAFFPVAGWLSDIYGRERIMYMGGLMMLVLWPIMIILIAQGDPALAFFAQCVMGVSLSLWGAPMCAWLVESFPESIRLTSVATGYNIAQAFIGGSSPAIATYLVDTIGNYSPGIMVSVIAVLSLFGLYIAPEANSIKESTHAIFSTYSDDEHDSSPNKTVGSIELNATGFV